MFSKRRTNSGTLSLIYLICLFILPAVPRANAQEVAKIAKAKKQVLVHVNDISNLKANQEGCISDAAGKRVVCGTIAKMQKGKVILNIKDIAKLARVKKGMKVTFTGARASAVAKRRKGGASPGAPVSSGAKRSPIVVRGLWLPALLGPVTYNKVAYNPPATTGGDNVLWISDALIRTSFLAFGASVTIPFGEKMGLTPGFRYRSYSGSTLETDYDPIQKTKFASITQSMTALGFWADFQFMKLPISSTMAISGNAGIDFEMSTALLTANIVDETNRQESKLADSRSKLSVISLRVGGGIDAFFMGPAGVSLGVNLLLPLVGMGQSAETTTEDGFQDRSPDDIGDLNTALNHKKASFGLDMSVGVAFGF